MGFNKTVKVICLPVLILGVFAALGMYRYRRMIVVKPSETVGPSAQAQVPASISPTPSPSPDLSTWQGALNAAYRGDMGHWHLMPSELDQWRGRSEGTTSTLLSTGVIDATSTIEKGQRKVYVALQTVPVPSFGCRACDAVLGGAVLVENNGLWSVEDLQKFIVVGGTSGHLSVDPTNPTSIIRVGRDRVAIEYYDEIDAQGGVRWGWTTLYAYLNGGFQNVFEMKNTMETTMWVCPATTVYGYDTRIEAAPGPKDFYDLQAIRRRTNITAKGKIVTQATTLSRYSFKDRNYVLISGWKPYTGPEKIEPYPALGPDRCLG